MKFFYKNFFKPKGKPKKLAFKDYISVYKKVPRICVDVIIKTPDGGVVLARRDIPPAKGKWHIPGSTILMNETFEDTIARVTKKEVGAKVKPKEIIGVTYYSGKESSGQAIALAYLTEFISGNLKGSNYHGKEVKVFKSIPKNTITEHIYILKQLGF